MTDSNFAMRLNGLENEIHMWIEQDSSIMLKAVTSTGDPVELTAEDARELGNLLLQVYERLNRR